MFHLRKKILFYLHLFFLPIFLSGCWDAREIDRLAYVVALGIDEAEDESNRIQVTYVIINPNYGPQNSSQGNEPPREIISIIADDFISARESANTVIAKEITYDALSDIVISEQLARSKDFIRYIYDASKDMEIRRNTELIVTKEDAYTFLVDTKPLIESEPHRYFKLIREKGQQNGNIPADSQLLYFTRITETGNDLFLSTYATSKVTKEPNPDQYDSQFKAGDLFFKGEVNNTPFAGSAVFKNGQMIGTMTGEETHLTNFLNNTLQSENVVTSLPDPFDSKYRMSLRINQQDHPKIHMNLKEGKPSVHVEIDLLVDVLTNHSMTEYFRYPEKIHTLENSITDDLQEKISRFIERTQKEFEGNPFGWSLIARKHFLTNKAFEDFDWMKQYPDLDVEVQVHVKLGRFGRQSSVPELKQ